MPRERALVLSQHGTRIITELTDDHAHTYAGYIRAAVREVGQNYRQVAIGSLGNESRRSAMAGGLPKA
jgi:hypothetical protein